MHIKLILLDLDGCIFHAGRSLNESQRSNPNWIIGTNLPLLSHIIADLKHTNYDKVILGYGTNRQDHNIDQGQLYPISSLAPVLPLFHRYISKKIANTHIEPFLMADIFGVYKIDKRNRTENDQFKTAGDSYKAILQHHYGNKVTPQESTISDSTKLSLIYAQLHRAASLHPQDTISVDFYEDNHDILTEMGNFFGRYPEMLPKNVEINIIPYNGTFFGKKQTIKGTGTIDHAYPWTLRYLATGKTVENLSDFNAKLQIAHQAWNYAPSLSGLKNYNSEQIHTLQNATATLPAQSALTNAAYTTSEQLVAEGLLPKSLQQITDSKATTTTLMQSLFKTGPGRTLEQIPLNNLREAVGKAVTKYEEWYQKINDHRGRAGLFTRLRHGQTGQNRAQRLRANINSDAVDSIGGALTVIKDLLTADKTRFHRHSFASFLMDELSELVFLNPEDLYDQASVKAIYQAN
ncbi:MAG: hypothetical protein BGO90_08140 [Legionella sp. 40-6]|nr:hypothetical protein [Legionella sp.]OJY25187.1 MAG: hypothetical protein BGO90_08140 [Legionella sp. 40-6]